ncbi:MAG: lipocalin family protein [Flavitalea sp.]
MIRYTKCTGIFMLIIIACASPSCKKEAPAKTKLQLLTTASWKLNALTVDPAYDYSGDGNSTTNLFALFEECTKDDYSTFRTDGTAVSDQGSLKCDPNEPQSFNMTWAFNEERTKITIDNQEYTIVELNSIQLRLTSQQTEEGVTYTRTAIFVH